MSHLRLVGLFAVLFSLCGATVAHGQEPYRVGAVTSLESAALSQGWTAMVNQKYSEAIEIARQAAAKFPQSVSILALGVESSSASRGSVAALDFYEAWLQGRRLDEPGVLRRVARALLFEWASRSDVPTVRLAALKALRDAGEAEAASALLQGAMAGNLSDTAALAALGHEQALDRLIERLEFVPGARHNEIRMLAESRNRRARPALESVLGDPLPDNRAAAAAALGNLGDPAAIPALVRVLEDPHGGVRLEAAGALLKLGDGRGRPLLQALASSEPVSARRSAALLLASDPDDAWLALVRRLTTEGDPLTRLDAARLLAPHDPGAAQQVLEGLLADQNPAVRAATEEVLASAPSTDLASLRAFLRSSRGTTAVAAAARLMTLTQGR
jgi:HEAT repeat protein